MEKSGRLKASFVFLLIGGVVLFLEGGYQQRRAASKAWSTTEGVVVESSVRSTRLPGEDWTKTTDDDIRQEPWHARVTYTYSVEGRSYQSSRVYLDHVTAYASQSKAQELVRKYPEGRRITVHYNPQNPDDAALELDRPWLDKGVLAAVVFLGLGIIGIISSLLRS
ncbi:MAG: hypothetical protein A3D93_01545 [Acidobacteria bacterium RIFCSPHIGHO2_12_FULL_67_30]|nr:MAG: hypothetical protein A2620_07235 [Acidobacteria bacterium RIFCSPHIGHO2_01_FULL_67_28]OFV86413.1 MAG: hypothetical protein A3B65_02235 [Acidobacteria bacterium RIFCSPHIGHO2_02_FULL_67_57]OFV86639.1 MAG: hypothetical protein A3D93_01545 [Acidobacteria bacterium RIFCSPHIGHO2_12_FULL_67_30]